MKKTIAIALLAATAVCLILATSACSTENKENGDTADAVESAEATPLGTLIDSGDLNNITGLNTTCKLSVDEGKYVNLYVENKGANDVVATINGSGSRTFKPGEKGCIYAELTQGSDDGGTECVFKVVTGKDGGEETERGVLLFEQALVIGEKRPFVAALVVVNDAEWHDLCAGLQLDPEDPATLVSRDAQRAGAGMAGIPSP